MGRTSSLVLGTSLATVLVAGAAFAGPPSAPPPPRVVHIFNPPAPHYDYSFPDKKPIDPEVEVARATPLLDWKARPLYRASAAEPITLAGGLGIAYDIQRHPTLPIEGSSDVLVYVWGARGAFREDGKPCESFSGFIRRSAIAKVTKGTVASEPDSFDRVTRARLDELEKISSLREVRVHAERTHGTYSSAHHTLADYGWAHDRLASFLYAAMNLPGYATAGGETGLVLANGDRVRATRIAARVHANEKGLDPRNDTFVLCVVDLPRPAGPRPHERMAVWIALANLPGVNGSELRVATHD